MVDPWYWPKNGLPDKTVAFSWIIKNKMAASWWPDGSVIETYKRNGIKTIINCSEFNNRKEISKDFKYFHINIPDYGIPTISQIERFLRITSNFETKDYPIVIHCVAGCGRTGIMIVAWAAYNGHIPYGLDPVKWIRKLRPCCLETKEQMELARKITSKYRK
jgi:protein-tyrosine phosphatase